nr:MAG TPA: hypothetical protein [Caudoviricetes sp.]
MQRNRAKELALLCIERKSLGLPLFICCLEQLSVLYLAFQKNINQK